MGEWLLAYDGPGIFMELRGPCLNDLIDKGIESLKIARKAYDQEGA